jgi:tetratricopeptide (TPR) repeat protein
MLKDPDFYTVTMARVYENQGLWDKASEIYQYLLEQEPQRKDFAEALSKVEREAEEAIRKKPDDLIPLFREWINLLLHYSRLRELRRFKGRLGG